MIVIQLKDQIKFNQEMWKILGKLCIIICFLIMHITDEVKCKIKNKQILLWTLDIFRAIKKICNNNFVTRMELNWGMNFRIFV